MSTTTKAEYPALNIELFRQTIEKVIAEANSAPVVDVDDLLDRSFGGTWDQGVWMLGQVGKRRRVDVDGDEWLEVRCGTAFCVAGYACNLAGDAFVAPNEPPLAPGQVVHAYFVMPKGSKEALLVDQRAADLLGLTDLERTELFLCENTLRDVFNVVQHIAFRRGIDPTLLGVPPIHP